VRSIPLLNWEPVSGFEPLTCRLQEVCSQAAHALAAPMTQAIALTAPAALGLFCASSHEPFHAHGGHESLDVTERSGQKPPQQRRDLPWSVRTVDQVDQVVALLNRAVLGSSGAGPGAPRAHAPALAAPLGAPAPDHRMAIDPTGQSVRRSAGGQPYHRVVSLLPSPLASTAVSSASIAT
jgi:hypothetical protein